MQRRHPPLGSACRRRPGIGACKGAPLVQSLPLVDVIPGGFSEVLTAARPRPQPVAVTVTDGDIGILSRSFRRSLEAANLSPATVRIYTISVAQLADFLAERGMPLVVASVTCEHL